MKQLLFTFLFISLASASINAQNKYRYHFAEHNTTYTAEELTAGIKLQVNDTSYYTFKFYDTRKSIINQIMFCNEEQKDIIRYFVPKELTPYEDKGKKEKVYWIKLN